MSHLALKTAFTKGKNLTTQDTKNTTKKPLLLRVICIFVVISVFKAR